METTEALRRRNRFTVLLWIALSAAAGVVVTYATNSILSGFLSHYPSTTSPAYTNFVAGDACLTCHSSSQRGAAGNAYRRALAANNVNFAALDLVDSDGDGVDNQTEVNTTRTDFPEDIGGVTQLGYNPGLIDCPDGRMGYDPVSMQVITGVHETPPGGTIWDNESPMDNCEDFLDNDCDGLKDVDDPDCAPGCTADADCNDGFFCNGMETCDTATGDCVAGTAPVVDDGVDCTVDFCDEDTDSVMHNPLDSRCDDTLFCNGAETCDPSLDCVDGPVPCAANETCDEATDMCLPGGCLSDANCDDGAFCNGAETCNTTTGQCMAGTPPDLDDGIECTSDVCDEENDMVAHTPLDSLCDDSLFCNGTETCDPSLDCVAGPAPCAAGETCDERQDTCIAEVLDLDIAKLRAPRHLRLGGKLRDIVLVVRNEGIVAGEALATLTSTNENGDQIVQTQMVSDPVGNGRTGFTFPFPAGLGAGIITHTVMLEDADPDADEATAASVVMGSPSSSLRSLESIERRGRRAPQR